MVVRLYGTPRASCRLRVDLVDSCAPSLCTALESRESYIRHYTLLFSLYWRGEEEGHRPESSLSQAAGQSRLFFELIINSDKNTPPHLNT